ncbi:hypothetical protein D6783_03280 [Candidatus Woesearchaeota archaeon]|nr:MAG: hypothetical protein D6783_03280 [Candidatus Woesearchaeota archaeon]
MEALQEIREACRELHEDAETPKNVRFKLSLLMQMLEGGGDISVCINRALTELEELASDVNVNSYVRMQLLSISSMLEMLESSVVARDTR